MKFSIRNRKQLDIDKIDKDVGSTNIRKLTGRGLLFADIIAITFSIYNLYMAIFGVPGAMYNRPTHLLFAIILVFLTVKGNKEANDKIKWFDYPLIVIATVTMGFILFNAEWFMSRWYFVTPLSILETFFGVLTIILILEMGRRTIGLIMPIISGVFLLYGYFGKFLPPPFGHVGFSFERIIESSYMTLDGIWTSPLYIAATYVSLFIFFGTLLAETGMGEFFADLASSIAGRTPGGTAKTAVISSGLMGMISGSSVANVVTTGTVTIPMMKKAGFKPDFAASVEAVASTGGQYMPPIMGAAAFIMAEFMGVGYGEIIKYAILPATLYFVSVYFSIDFRSRKMGMQPMNKEDIPRLITVMKRGYMFIPLILITFLVMNGYSAMRSALWGIIGITVIVLATNIRQAPFIILNAMKKAPKSIMTVTAACANAGIIIGIITMTGIGLRISSIVMKISGGHLWIALMFSILIAIILGMGMPSSGAYVIMATLLAPGLVSMGIGLVQAHFFLFYFTAVSAITPPVAIASYAASGIAESDPFKTGFTAFRLGISAYIIPIFFISNPALLMIGTTKEIIQVTITSLIGIYSLASAMEGWLLTRANWIVRIIMATIAILCIDSNILTDIIGIILLAIAFAIQILKRNYNSTNEKILQND